MPSTGTARAVCASCETLTIDAAARVVAVKRRLRVLLRFMTLTPVSFLLILSWLLFCLCRITDGKRPAVGRAPEHRAGPARRGSAPVARAARGRCGSMGQQSHQFRSCSVRYG